MHINVAIEWACGASSITRKQDDDGVDETQSVSFAHESFALVNAVSPPYSLPAVAP